MSAFIRMLISATGAGHQACAEAIEAALDGRAEVDMVDPFVDADLPGLRKMPAIYDWFGEHREAWGFLWHLLDGPNRARLLSDPAWLAGPRTYTKLITSGDPDLVVVLHPYLTTGARRALRGRRASTALATVVTDPFTPHASWFEPEVDHLIVSTAAAEHRALECGVPSMRVERIGHPIHPRVHALIDRREALRARFGWERPVVLITGDGSGVGIRESLATARGQGAEVVVVCGRDRALEARLFGLEGVEVLGFVDDLPERMCAADLVLSKAGPSTLAECRAVGTPVLVTSHMPGQEEGNLVWVSEEGFGEVAEQPRELDDAIARWLAATDHRDRLRAEARRRQSERPAEAIAERLLELVAAIRVRRAA